MKSQMKLELEFQLLEMFDDNGVNSTREKINKLRMMRRQADCFELSQFNLRS